MQRPSLIPSALAPSIFQPRALPGWMHQRQRSVHNRLQSAWDAAKYVMIMNSVLEKIRFQLCVSCIDFLHEMCLQSWKRRN